MNKRLVIIIVFLTLILSVFIIIINKDSIINEKNHDNDMNEIRNDDDEIKGFLNSSVERIITDNNLSQNNTTLSSYRIVTRSINYSYFINISNFFNISGNVENISNGYKVTGSFNSKLCELTVEEEEITFINFSLREKSNELSKDFLINKSMEIIDKISNKEDFHYVNHSKRTCSRISEINGTKEVIDSSYIIEFRQELNNHTVLGKRGRITLEISNGNIVTYCDRRIFADDMIENEEKVMCKCEKDALSEAILSQNPKFEDNGQPLDLISITLGYGIIEDGSLVPTYEFVFERDSYHLRTVQA